MMARMNRRAAQDTVGSRQRYVFLLILTVQKVAVGGFAFCSGQKSPFFIALHRYGLAREQDHQQDDVAQTEAASSLVIETTNTSPLLLGGDYAGLSATFSATTGALIPVPEHLVPESLLEWGQGPSCLEVIVSEHVGENTMTRHTVTVVPEVGCGVDNLDTIKSQEQVDQSRIKRFHDDSVVAMDYPISTARRCETVFAIENGQRLRVMVDTDHVRCSVVKEQVNRIKSPIVIVLERKTSETSTNGTIADAGGLDGRAVSRLLGDQFKGKPFCEQDPITSWKRREGKDLVSHNALNLPGNVTVAAYTSASTSSEWILKMSHVQDGASRRVVQRRFTVDGAMISPIEYWIETKP